MIVQVSCPVYPTEDTQKIEKALTNLFHTLSIEQHQEEHYKSLVLEFSTQDGFSVVKQHIHDLRIIDVIRRRIEMNTDGTKTSFHLDKQAAFSNKIRLIDEVDDEPPLGSITIAINCVDENELNSFIMWFVPPTKDGKILQS